jgi:signal transduction histidine kinase
VSFISSSIDLISRSIEELTEILDCHFEGHGRLDPKLQQLRQDLDYEYRLTTLKANASICRDGARRAAQIVRDLRTFCRPAPGRREEADLHESLDQALRLLHSEYKGHITIHREYGEIPRVLCDSGQMGQVFVNLLTNAIHAIKGHGEIHLRTSCENGYVSVEVQDNGTGMDEVTLSRIFDPFFTTKDVGKGTGLGLSIVRSLVSAHGGDITVRSRLGEGAVFRVTIPINGGQHEQQQ